MSTVVNTVCVVGLGHVGLPTAALLAKSGLRVFGVDLNEQVVQGLNGGRTHIHEPGLPELVAETVRQGKLSASTKVAPADVFIITVPTPVNPDNSPDHGAVAAAARAIMPHLRAGNLVVLESTVGPRTTAGLVAPILQGSGLRAGEDFLLTYCPERVLPGNALAEMAANDRVVGGLTPSSAEAACQLYKRFVKGRLHVTDATTAEVVKLSENTYRDVNIALANELALLCQRLGLDAWEVVKLANYHPRVHLLQPGPGVGGHCIPVDPWFLVAVAPELMRLVPTARQVNHDQPREVVRQALALLPDPRASKVAVLGVAYKADVEDARETPALDVVRGLEDAGVKVAVHDPLVQDFARPLTRSLVDAVSGASIAVLVTDHREYRELDPAQLAAVMRSRKVLDTRHCLDAERWRAAGFEVVQLGVGPERY
ncbi:MAG: nucleotide sugar dehydrogenase [Dehalococcoidia bacterium]|nr:nucleotide sugar dehydrogenase [Dehalococcoidia bacterium]